MATRLTLPQKRGRETQQRILEAAAHVFARKGYGQTTVEDIANEAEISIGALYHHFSGKEEIFKALLESHAQTTHREFRLTSPAGSFREVIEQIAGFWLDHLQSEHEFGDLFLDFVAEARRDPWAREVVGEHQREDLLRIEGMLRLGQSAGIVRRDLDSKAAAVLLAGCLLGVDLLQSLDQEGIDLARLRGPLVDLIEGFIAGENAEDAGVLAGILALREQIRERARRPSSPGPP